MGLGLDNESAMSLVISRIISYFKSSSCCCCCGLDMECLASEVKLFGECLLRLNRCVYCVVDPETRCLVYTFIETQEPLHVSDEWVVFRSQVISLREAERRIQIPFTKARVLDVNDVAILYSDGTALCFVTHSNDAKTKTKNVDPTEFHMLTPTGFAVQDRDHTKIRILDIDHPTMVLVNAVPSNMTWSRYILNHHGDSHLIVRSEKTSEHWVVDLKGHKYRLPHPPAKIHRRFIQLDAPGLVFRRDAASGKWDSVKDTSSTTTTTMNKKTPKKRSWVASMAASHALVRIEDWVGRNASSWMLMNTGVKLETVE